MPVLVRDDDAEWALDGVDRTDDTRRVAGDQHAGRHVRRSRRCRRRPSAFSPIVMSGRSVTLTPMRAPRRIVGPCMHFGANRVRIVGDRHARRQEHIVFDRRELGDVDVAMDLHAVADDAAVIDRRVVPERAVARRSGSPRARSRDARSRSPRRSRPRRRRSSRNGCERPRRCGCRRSMPGRPDG